MPEGMQIEVDDYDRDSIHTLALAYIPLRSVGLKRARLIKNVRMHAAVEIYREAGTGSAQIGPSEIPDFFGGSDEDLVYDQRIIERLAELESFDVYSLRIGLRDLEISVSDQEVFELSDAKKDELLPYMRDLTRPLLAYLYGDESSTASDVQTLLNLFTEPNDQQVRERIERLAMALNVTPSGLPNALASFGDIFLSLSYFRSYLTRVLPRIEDIVSWSADVRENSFISRDERLSKQVQLIEGQLRFLSQSVGRRFEIFDSEYKVDWERVNIDTYRMVQTAIESHQASMASTLCGLTVKVFEWENKFPRGDGGPEKRAEFMVGEVGAGLERLIQVEKSAPRFEDLET